MAKMIDNRDNPCIRQCLCTYTRLEALYQRETIAQKSLVVVEALLQQREAPFQRRIQRSSIYFQFRTPYGIPIDPIFSGMVANESELYPLGYRAFLRTGTVQSYVRYVVLFYSSCVLTRLVYVPVLQRTSNCLLPICDRLLCVGPPVVVRPEGPKADLTGQFGGAQSGVTTHSPSVGTISPKKCRMYQYQQSMIFWWPQRESYYRLLRLAK